MKYIIMVLIILCTFCEGTAKGLSGQYTILGTIYDKNTKTPLANMTFLFNDISVTTNKNGDYKIKFKWGTCDRGMIIRRWICNSKSNNKVEITSIESNYHKSFKSRWRKYGLRHHPRFGNKKSRNRDTVFVKNLYIKNK